MAKLGRRKATPPQEVVWVGHSLSKSGIFVKKLLKTLEMSFNS
jgi:hypothetical protein